MSASSAPTLINLPPLPKPRTVNELANSINYTYREINRGFSIISRAFVFEKTLVTGNVTTVGTQIGGFLISDTTLVSTNTTDGLQIGLYSAAATSGVASYALVAGDVATSGTQTVTIGNGVSYGHLVQVNNVVVAQMRRGLFNNHGYLSIRKSDGANVITADGNTNATTIGGSLGVTGAVTCSTNLTVGNFLFSGSSLVSTDTSGGYQLRLTTAGGSPTVSLITGDIAASGTQTLTTGNGIVYGHFVQVNGVTVAQLRRGLFNDHGYLSITKTDGTNVFTAIGSTNATTVGGTLGVSGLITGSAGLTVTGITTLEVLQFSAGGYLKFPGVFVAGAPVATGYLIARDNVGAIYKLLCAP